MTTSTTISSEVVDAPPRRRGARAAFGLLGRNADFRRLFFASLISYMGDWFAFVAVSGFVTDRTGRGGLGALVYAASVLPVFLLSPVAGVLADRMDRRRLMVAVNLLQVLPALTLLLALRWGSPWLAIAGVTVLAALSAFLEPVANAVVPNLVEPEDLSLAQAVMGSAWGVMLFVGAAIGGVVSAQLGRETSFLVDAATFVVAAGLVLRIRRPMQGARAAEGSLRAHLAEVWNLARRFAPTRSLLVTKLGIGLSGGIVGLLPAFVLTRFRGGDDGVGMLLACRGLGALVGPLLGHLYTRGNGRRIFLACGGSMLLYGVAYGLLPFAPSLAWAAGCIMAAHLGGGAQWALSTYGLQVTTPDALRGRVLSLDFGLATLSIGVSSVFASGAAEVLGLDGASWALAAMAVLCGGSWLWWTRRLWQGTDDPLRPAHAQER